MQKKWMLFDFGGCLDSDGVQARTMFYDAFSEHFIIEKDLFNLAYSYADQKVIDESLVVECNLLGMNEIMCDLIAKSLSLGADDEVKAVARKITAAQEQILKRNATLLKTLKSSHGLGVISHFSGNLSYILEEFGMFHLFDFILDSYHVGQTRPDLIIFRKAIEHCHCPMSSICFVGDNFERDIAPAKSLGMKTVYLNQLTRESAADYTITSLTELMSLQNL